MALFRDCIKTLKKAKTSVEGLNEAVKGIETVVDTLDKLAKSPVKLSDALKRLRKVADRFGKALKLIPPGTPILGWIGTALKVVLDALEASLKALEKIVEQIEGALKAIAPALKAAREALDGAKKVFEKVLKNIDGLLNLLDLLEKQQDEIERHLPEDVKKAIRDLCKQIGDLADELDGLGKDLKSLLDKLKPIADALKAAYDEIENKLKKIEDVAGTLEKAADIVDEVLGKIPDEVKEGVEELSKWVAQGIDWVLQQTGLKKKLEEALEPLKKQVEEALDPVLKPLKQIKEQLDKARELFDKANEKLDDLAKKAKQLLNALKNLGWLLALLALVKCFLEFWLGSLVSDAQKTARELEKSAPPRGSADADVRRWLRDPAVKRQLGELNRVAAELRQNLAVVTLPEPERRDLELIKEAASRLNQALVTPTKAEGAGGSALTKAEVPPTAQIGAATAVLEALWPTLPGLLMRLESLHVPAAAPASIGTVDSAVTKMEGALDQLSRPAKGSRGRSGERAAPLDVHAALAELEAAIESLKKVATEFRPRRELGPDYFRKLEEAARGAPVGSTPRD